MKKYLSLFVVIFLFVACGSDDTTGPNPSENDIDVVTMRAIDGDGSSQVEIPLNLFGDSESDLDGASFDIATNDFTRNTDLDPQDYFVESVDLVAFIMNDLADGDEVTFTLNLATGGTTIYMGNFSSTTDEQAALEASDSTTDDDSDSDSDSDSGDSGTEGSSGTGVTIIDMSDVM